MDAGKFVRGYRFTFQSQESDDEIRGKGNSLNYKFRMHDPRIGRWMSIDPLSKDYTSLSPYNYVNNNPLLLIDPDGSYFTGNVKSVQAVYSIISKLAALGDERAIAFKEALEKMDASDVEFHIQNNSRNASYNSASGGSTSFDTEKNRVLIDVYDFYNGEHSVSEEARTGHELEHGSQFLDGEIGFKGEAPDILYYDETDEENAFKVQNLISNTQLSAEDNRKTDDDAKKAALKYRLPNEESSVTPEQAEMYKNSPQTLRTTFYNYKPSEKQKNEKIEILNDDE